MRSLLRNTPHENGSIDDTMPRIHTTTPLRKAGIAVLFVLSGCSDTNSKRPQDDIDQRQGETRTVQAVATSPPQQAATPARPWPDDYGKEEYPGGAFALVDSGSPPPGDAARVIAALEPSAVAGNSKASFEIFQKLHNCLSILRHSQDTSPHGTGTTGDDSQHFADCENLTEEHYVRLSYWLDLAASQGSLSAQLTYASSVESVIGEAADYLRDPHAVLAYKERSYAYLMNAARHGNVNALLSLGNRFGYGIMVERDFVTSYAYFLAAQRIAPDFVSEVKTSFLRDQLTQEQYKEAMRKGDAIHDECCNRK